MAEAGTVITNTISTGPGENELYMTFTYEWDFPNVREDSEEAKEKERQLAATGAQGVPYAIDVIRAMAQEGKL
jgi:hypothetical protein